jgi:hypothetical protein
MMMVKDVLIYSSLALFVIFWLQLWNGHLTDVPAECLASQFCGGYMQPIPPPDTIDTWR